MINPVHHTLSAEGIATYKAEPCVVAADVYAVAPHVGRGGWSWYTGSAGWMYQLVVESLLGLRLAGATLHLAPCLPADWPGYTIRYRYRETVYHIVVSQSHIGDDAQSGVTNVTVDGVERHDRTIPLIDDRQEHQVEVNVTTR